MLLAAAKEWQSNLSEKRTVRYDDRNPFDVEAETTTGEEAESIADVPRLDGDPENDRIELAETALGTDWQAEYAEYMKEKRGG